MDDKTRVDMFSKDGLRGKASMKSFPAGSPIIARDQKIERLHFLYAGTAAIVPLHGSGVAREQLTANCHEERYAGLAVMSYRTRRPASAAIVAVTDCEVAMFDSPALASAIREKDEFAKKLVYALLVRSDASRPILLQLCEQLHVIDAWTGTEDPEEFYLQRLRPLTGLDEAVKNVMARLLEGRRMAKRQRDPNASEASLVVSPTLRPTR